MLVLAARDRKAQHIRATGYTTETLAGQLDIYFARKEKLVKHRQIHVHTYARTFS